MRQIDRKYQTSGDITKLDGTPIPEDEPLVLFRGKDNLLVPLLEQYKKMCEEAGSYPKHFELLQLRIDDIKDWQAKNPSRLNVPGSSAAYAPQN
jgi:hypothetical protein